jgi:hypothetical protein
MSNEISAIQFDENGLFEISDEQVLARVVGGTANSGVMAQPAAQAANDGCTLNSAAHCGA